jgi:WD40 repeat protein
MLTRNLSASSFNADFTEITAPPRPSVKPPIPAAVHFSPLLLQKTDFSNRNIAICQVVQPHCGAIRCIASSHDGFYIATGGEDGVVIVYLFSGFLSIARKVAGHSADITCMTFSCDDIIISASLDGTVRLWHASHPRELGIFKHDEAVIAVAVHPTNSSLFLACTFGNVVLVWSIRDNEILQTLQFVSPPTAAAFSPDGRRVAIGCYNGACFVYSLPDYRYVTQFIAGPRRKKKTSSEKVTSIVFVSASQFLISTNDSRIRLYSSDNFSVIRKYVGHVAEDAHQKLTLSPDKSSMMIASEENGAVLIWPIDHEESFKGSGVHKFSRERSKTAEGFELGKKESVTGAIFTIQHTPQNMSVLVTDTEGQMFLVLSV